ncbi:hypothetical protein N657DRAFT_200519 [Parathielavia appendiculata]|uniref:Uncharacterized protein n=1 Tax=Parathielavia appendiculata TaxID=2587402 RepID=A0AAN6Z7A0_9PEZI|nr:hypothetical protein N657DRAFT_200519 [Parathielavia appendiculata]
MQAFSRGSMDVAERSEIPCRDGVRCPSTTPHCPSLPVFAPETASRSKLGTIGTSSLALMTPKGDLCLGEWEAANPAVVAAWPRSTCHHDPLSLLLFSCGISTASGTDRGLRFSSCRR